MRTLGRCLRAIAGAVALLAASVIWAQAPAGPIFEKDIYPIFTQYCSTCHGQSSPKLGLDLRTAASALRGTHNGPVIVKGSPDQSVLYQKLLAREMPPPIYGQTVPDSAIAAVRRWIESGALSEKTADKETIAQRERFEKNIQPIFTSRCIQCHGASKPMGNLDLRTLTGVLKGSAGGPVVIEGFSDRSVLVRKIASGAMPPKGTAEPLTEADIRTLREWIDRGHLGEPAETNPADRPLTVAEAPPVTAAQRNFWSFQAPQATQVPKVKSQQRVRTPIDGFLLKDLEAAGLTFSPDATEITLVRRAYFDLTGLPPTPQQVQAFLNDRKSDAYERLLDQLLASPHYGERWGRHWLDAVGYVDTQHKDLDAARGSMVQGMWRYRDYVIKSLNDDKPWNRFLIEQIAGDELVDWRSEAHYAPRTVELLTATGYMRNVLDITDEEIANLPVERYEALFKLAEKVSSSTMGLTIQCARCHTHKFDPIPQRDYYRFLAVFMPAYNPGKWLPPKQRDLPTVSKVDKEEIERYNAEIDKPVGDLKKKLADIRRPYEQKILNEKFGALPEDLRDDARVAYETPKEKRTELQKYLYERLEKYLKVPDADVRKAFTAEDTQSVARLEAQIKEWNAFRRKLETIPALWDVGDPPTVRLLERGSAEHPGPKVTPGFLEVLSWDTKTDAAKSPNAQGKTSGLRLAFAEWLTSRQNPLTARVIVNRVWQHHFGTGIVATSDNFGKTGSLPSNQALLDWLAVDFMDHGWSEKRLHKLIMTSTAYRQSSHQGHESWVAKAKVTDPTNRLLWRMNLHRLEAEVLRDAVLSAAGQLDESIGGPPVMLGMQDDGLQIVSPKESSNAKYRRSVYLMARRTYPMSFLAVFDYPIIDANCTRRVPSATPLQALTLLNDEFMLTGAHSLAQRMEKTAGSGNAAKIIDAGYWIAFGRPATAAEIQASEEYLQKQQLLYGSANIRPDDARQKALDDLAHVLLSTNEFLYID